MSTTEVKELESGVFYQLNPETGFVIAGMDDIPPVHMLEPVQPEGWVFLGEILDIDVGRDGWLELYIYEREE